MSNYIILCSVGVIGFIAGVNVGAIMTYTRCAKQMKDIEKMLEDTVNRYRIKIEKA